MSELTIVPLGGLGNRMRAILSAHAAAVDLGIPLRVVWLRDKGLNCKFSTLFSSLPKGITLLEGSRMDAIRYGVPMRRNLFMPRLFQRSSFDLCLFDKDVIRMRAECGEEGVAEDSLDEAMALRLRTMMTGKRIMIASGLSFYPADDKLLSFYFRPQPELEEKINVRCANFTPSTVGVHIRRTDNLQSISGSPLDMYVEVMEKDMEEDASTTFYVASDDEEVRNMMDRRFPHRVMYSDVKPERNSVEGMCEAVVEMYALSRTRRFHGAYYSSYSDIVVAMSDGRCDIVRKKE